MDPLPDTALTDIEAHLRRQLARAGVAYVSADALAEAICARCHEEVRVWAENFARSEGTALEELEEDAAQAWLVFRSP